ncbi:hypothetical protein EST38_g7108 [Candolleomyces aberdarensis]|uniref:RBR-type E3 ubiquitin transferase n=1 Tax=Candolleomyces aberdarensis TaxID=2316362 RepID=A0A4Q2DFY4_9AGAR|nr:hypothetical protein EST38_g7108 [Candolleomyces aberdarensis]
MPPKHASPTNGGGGSISSPPFAKKECKFYKQGSCRKGGKCTFLHMARIGAPPNAATYTTSNVIVESAPTNSEFLPNGSSGVNQTTVRNQHVTVAEALQSTGGQQAEPRRKAQKQQDPGRATAGTHEPPVTPGPPEPSVLPPARRPGGESKIQQSMKGRPAAEKPCFAWQRGLCEKGDQCRYRHDPLEKGPIQNPNDSLARNILQQRQLRRQEEERQREEEQRRQEEEERRRQEEERRRQEEEEERQRQEEEERRQEQERLERERAEREAERLAAIERLRREKEEREARQRRKMEEIKRREEQKREAEAKLTHQLIVHGSNLVTFGAGLELKRVIPGFDLCSITIKNLPRDANRFEIANLLREQGMDDTMFQLVSCKREGNTTTARFLLRAEEAQAMAIGLEDLEFRDNLIKLEVGDNASWGSMTSSSQNDNTKTLTVIWSIPSATMVATYDTVDEAKRKARQLDGRSLNRRKIKAAMNARPNGPAARYWVEASVKLMNLNPETDVIDVEEIAGTDRVRPIKSNTYDLEWFISWLKAAVEREGCIPGSFETAKVDDNRMRAVAKFQARDTLERAAATLQRGIHISFAKRGPILGVIVPAEHQYTIKISTTQYRAQKAQWDTMTEGRGRGKAFVRINEKKNGLVFINVEGSDQQEIGPLKVRVEGLVAGERLDAEHWHNSFLNSQKTLCEKVSAETGAFLSVDRRFQALRVFGGSDVIAAAKNCIRDEVQRLALMEYEIPIARQSVRFFVATGLHILKDALGEDNVTLDVAACTLKLKGGDDALQHAGKLVEEALAAASDGVLPSAAEDNEDGAVCPICYDTASHPEVLSCGHSYCEPCLRHYLTSAVTSNKFPLVCMGDETTCNTLISIPIIQRYLTKQRFDDLIDIVFSAHIQSNSQKFKYCTTPDCTQIYQCDTGKQFHKCPSCFSEICSSCNEEAHKGMTCEERRIQNNPAEQERLTEEWARSNNIKRCPSCNILTEKTEGCNHMECRCGVHFCWLCRGVFDRAMIHQHMQTVHGGIYVQDGDPAPAPAPYPVFGDHVLREHILAEREIEAARFRRAETQRLVVEEECRQRERAARIQIERMRRREEQLRLVVAQERRKTEELRLAAEVARWEAEKKNEGSFCSIM